MKTLTLYIGIVLSTLGASSGALYWQFSQDQQIALNTAGVVMAICDNCKLECVEWCRDNSISWDDCQCAKKCSAKCRQ